MGELLHFVYALHQRYHGFAALLGNDFLPIGQIAGNLGEHGGGNGFGQQIHLGNHLGGGKQVLQHGFAGDVGFGFGRIMLRGELLRGVQQFLRLR